MIEAGVIDETARSWTLAADTSIESALDSLSAEVRQLAEQIDATHGEQWARRASVAGGASVTALELAQEAARSGSEHLRAAEAAMQAARQSR